MFGLGCVLEKLQGLESSSIAKYCYHGNNSAWLGRTTAALVEH